MIVPAFTNPTSIVGPSDAPIMVVVGSPYWDGRPLSDASMRVFTEAARQAGLSINKFQFHCLSNRIQRAPGTVPSYTSPAHLLALAENPAIRIIVPLDTPALSALTGKSTIDKWQLSILRHDRPAGPAKVIPVYHPEQSFRSPDVLPFVMFGLRRIAEELKLGPAIEYKTRTFKIFPSLGESLVYLRNLWGAEYCSVDIETRKGQITCIGLGATPTEAISIPTLPGDYPIEDFHRLWRGIAVVLAGPSKKVFQNFIYDSTFLAAYGMQVNNLWMDTMLATKFLHPELPADLGTIGRLYTKEPFWKDEGKGGDLSTYYIYNAKDVTCTLEAAHVMYAEMLAAGTAETFQRRIMALAAPATEMCWNGLLVDPAKRDEIGSALRAEVESMNTELATITAEVVGKPVNSRSPKQVKDYLKARKYRVPVKKGKETSNVTALLKLQAKHPDDRALPLLIELSEKNKRISSYIKPPLESDGRVRFSINLHGTIPGRWSASKTLWDMGFNPQTMPGAIKPMIIAPPGWLLAEIDLRQADARVVAWDAPEPTLMKFFTEGRDIHRFVASQPELFNKPEADVTKDERQLGKKTGHAANYGMMGATHSEACLLEMGLHLTPDRAQSMLDGYHRTFPGIKMWQARIREELARTRVLRTPFGRSNTFWGPLNDDMFRRAYAYRPPSTVVDVINSLIMHIHTHRDPARHIHALQVHDSSISYIHESYLDDFVAIVRAQDEWNPKIPLRGGTLQIPIELKVGPNLKTMTEIHL